MIPELGQLCLIIALCLAFIQAVLPMIGAQRGNSALIAVAKPTAHGQFLFLLLAFGFLTRVKKKQYFAQYIPKALKTLKLNLGYFPEDMFPNLTHLAEKLDVT